MESSVVSSPLSVIFFFIFYFFPSKGTGWPTRGLALACGRSIGTPQWKSGRHVTPSGGGVCSILHLQHWRLEAL